MRNAFLFFVIVAQIFAQFGNQDSGGPILPEQAAYDVKFYKIDLEINPDNKFISLEKSRIDYILKNLLYDYPNYHARLSQEEFQYNPQDYSFMNSIDFSNLSHFNINEYNDLLYRHLQQLYWLSLSSDSNKEKSEVEKKLQFFNLVDSLVSETGIRDYLKHKYTTEIVQWENLDIAEKIANFFILSSTTDLYLSLIHI